MKSCLALASLVLIASAGFPSASLGQDGPGGLSLVPSRAEGVASEGLTVGPFGLSNRADIPYSVRVIPVLIGQSREGGIVPRDDATSLKQARKHLRPGVKRFTLNPGARDSADAVLRKLLPAGGFYGGLLFEATPRTQAEEQQIIEVLRLNAGIFLHPPAEHRKLAVGVDQVRGEQDGSRIKLLVATRNKGNAYERASGEIRVLDTEGDQLTRRALTPTEILPGTTVDLTASLDRDLDPGTYVLKARVSIGGKSDRATGELTIGADGRVVFEAAEITEFTAPAAYEGEPIEVEATYANTGNSTFSPEARLLVRPSENGGIGDVIATQALEAEEAEFDEEGIVSGQVDLSDDAEAYELELQLRSGDRVLDTRSVSVTFGEEPGLLSRVSDFITENAVLLVLLLLGLLVVGALLVFRYVRRLRAQTKSPADRAM